MKKIPPLTTFEHPKSEQGIIFPFILDSKIREYLEATAQIVGDPKHIIAASRISNNRVAIFLSNTSLVDTLSQTTITISNQQIQGRLMKSKPKKLILSNVSPTIPNSTIEEYLRNQLNLKLTSKISLLRVNPKDDIFGHVISYRRQVYVHELNEKTIPSSFILQDEDISHRIFLTQDELTCFKCHSRLHKAEDCTSFDAVTRYATQPQSTDNIENSSADADNQNLKDNPPTKTSIPDLTPFVTPIDVSHIKIPVSTHRSVITLNTPTVKEQFENFSVSRSTDASPLEPKAADAYTEAKAYPHPITSSAEKKTTPSTGPNKRSHRRPSSSSTATIDNTINKKPKSDDQESTQTSTLAAGIINAITEFCESDINTFKLHPDDLTDFVNELQARKTCDVNIKDYAADETQFLDSLVNLHKAIKNKSTKNRLTRFIKLHRPKPNLNSEEDDSDSTARD